MTKDFWETCDTDFAHITAGKYQTYDDAVAVWHKEFWDTCSWHDKIVVDYGCGGGWLYKELASIEPVGLQQLVIGIRSIALAMGGMGPRKVTDGELPKRKSLRGY